MGFLQVLIQYNSSVRQEVKDHRMTVADVLVVWSYQFDNSGLLEPWNESGRFPSVNRLTSEQASISAKNRINHKAKSIIFNLPNRQREKNERNFRVKLCKRQGLVRKKNDVRSNRTCIEFSNIPSYLPLNVRFLLRHIDVIVSIHATTFFLLRPHMLALFDYYLFYTKHYKCENWFELTWPNEMLEKMNLKTIPIFCFEILHLMTVVFCGESIVDTSTLNFSMKKVVNRL